MAIGASEAEPFWIEFLRDLVRRGLAGVKLVISDAHEGIKAAIARALATTWQRCRVHFNGTCWPMPARTGERWWPPSSPRSSPNRIAPPPGPVASSPTRAPASCRSGALLRTAEDDVLAYMSFPQEHRARIYSTNPIERLNREIKRRTDVVGIFPNEASIRRLVGAILMEQTEEWTVQRGRYLTLETLAPVCDDLTVSLPAAQRD